MKRFLLGVLAALVVLVASQSQIAELADSSTVAAAAAQETDSEIRQAIIRESIARYSGSCPCPYSVDRGGRRCRGRCATVST